LPTGSFAESPFFKPKSLVPSPTILDFSSLPIPSARPVAIRVTPPAERALKAGHPWLFERAILRASHVGEDGDVAVVFDRKGRFLAAGLWDSQGPIRVRVLTAGVQARIGPELFHERVTGAVAHRAPLARDPAVTGIRWIFGESDRLPGVILDGYGGHGVLKLYSAAWLPHLADLVEAIQGVLNLESLLLLTSRTLQRGTGAHPACLEPTQLLGSWPSPKSGALPFQEHGAWFEAHPLVGHKTGFYLDQRENRRRLMADPGAHVLNVFSYTGGFSVAAARGGAREIVSVDVSQSALRQADRHMELNRAQAPEPAFRHETLGGDAFQVMRSLAEARRRFDTVVVDPPAFAKERSQVDRALTQYARLTQLALPLVRPGGRLVQSSCSARIEGDVFEDIIQEAAARAGRPLHDVDRTGHPLDHPARFPESTYLKTVWARAE